MPVAAFLKPWFLEASNPNISDYSWLHVKHGAQRQKDKDKSLAVFRLCWLCV